MEMVMTGDHYSAERMNAVSSMRRPMKAKLWKELEELAARIAINGPLAELPHQKIMKEYKTGRMMRSRANRKIMNSVFASDEVREGATAFAEKRARRKANKSD